MKRTAVTLAAAIVSVPLLSAPVTAAENYVPDIPPRDLPKEFKERKPDAADNKGSEPGVTLKEGGNEQVPHITITRFSFRNLPEYPEAGVTRETVEQFAETLRKQYMKSEEVLDNGFTRKELDEVTALLRKKALNKNPDDISLDDLKELVSILRRQTAERGMTYGDIEKVAQQITRFYRERGLLLARAFIPPQEVRQGVVELDIVAGKLGKVVVSGNHKYQPEQLQEPFNDQLGELVDNARIEESIYLLNDYPGLSVYGYFEKGDNPGESNLNLQVRDEETWSLAIRADNHGSELTGENRVYTVGNWYNPTGIGDQLTLGALKSFNPENTDLFQLVYSLPVFSADTRLEFYAEQNRFDISSKADEIINRLNITGANDTYSATLMHQLKRSRAANLATGFKYSDKRVTRDASVPLFTEGDHANTSEIIIEGDFLGDSIRTLNMGRLSLMHGRLNNTVPEDRGDTFYRLALDTNSLFFVPLPFTDNDSRLVVKSKWRYSNNPLPSFEQMALGGANTVRAFTGSEFSADTGVYLGAEWYFDLPGVLNYEFASGRRLSDRLQYAVLFEGAYGHENSYKFNASDTRAPDPWAHLAGAGLLFRFNWDDRFVSTLTVARPVSSRSGSDLVGNDARSWRTYIDATYQLR
ncbi:ShlB/FhaC/HecB family hemolysin secretion/activation protein [Endozoicomonas lisbonensis]|uniref:Hemolysin activation/secretion protein n=1 Tax=Endozoicomonas lisbonensis TaxID=3120522 RepID=A0ABV2SCJ5_9GAMM